MQNRHHSPAERALALGLPWVRPNKLIEQMVDQWLSDIFYLSDSDELRRRAKAAIEARRNSSPDLLNLYSTRFLSIYLLGPPGGGKTFIVERAAGVLASILGMTFHPTTHDGAIYGEFDLLLLSQELAGETTSMNIRGLFDRTKISVREGTAHGDRHHCGADSNPVSDRLEEVTAMDRIVAARLMTARQAGVVIWLFDDFSSAPNAIQTSIQRLITHRETEGRCYRNFIPVLCGNVSGDGSFISTGSSAIATRSRMIYFEEDRQDFIDRLRRQFPDQIGTGYVCEYLTFHPEDFDLAEGARHLPNCPRPTPRTWHASILEMRALERQYRSAPLTERPDIRERQYETISQFVGPAVGRRFADFIQMVSSHVYPLADQMMNEHYTNDALANVQRGLLPGKDNDLRPEQFSELYANHVAEIAVLALGGERSQDEELAVTVFAAFFKALLAPDVAPCSHPKDTIPEYVLSNAVIRLKSGLLSSEAFTQPAHGVSTPQLNLFAKTSFRKGIVLAMEELRGNYGSAVGISAGQLKRQFIAPFLDSPSDDCALREELETMMRSEVELQDSVIDSC